MFYRVKKYHRDYRNMFVLDKDSNLDKLKSRIKIQNCASGGYRPFNNPELILSSQIIECVSLDGQKRNSDIIKA
jgi:hypothetical protein